MTIKAVLFDLDGVLIDAKEWHYESLNESLIRHNIKPISRELHLSNLDGLPTKNKLLAYEATKSLSADEMKAINVLKQEITEQMIEKNAKPNNNHIDAITSLVDSGLSVGCCSNSSKNTVDLMLRKVNLFRYMKVILTNADVVNSKPDSEIYDTALSKLMLNPNEVLILEDNIRGINAGIASGCFVMEIGLLEDVTIGNISDAIDLINSNNNLPQLIRPKIRMARIREMVKGYFVGNFYPSILQSDLFEAGVKVYKKGDKEGRHYHKISTEITLIVSGKVIMCDRVISAGEMILMEPGIETSFEALEDSTTFVIKTPSNNSDKYDV